MLVPTSPHVELRDERNSPVRVHLRGEPAFVWDYKDGPRDNPDGGEPLTLQDALDRGLIASVPNRFCFQILSRECGQVVVWTGAAYNPRILYPELFEKAAVFIVTDYYLRSVEVYHYNAETNKWGLTLINNLGTQGFWPFVRPARGYDSPFTLVPATPICRFCGKSNRPVHPELGFCLRCLTEGLPQQHTEECLQRRAWQVRQQVAFFLEHCDGEGFLTTSGGRWEPPGTDACPKCVGKEKCLRLSRPEGLYLQPFYSLHR